MKKIFHFLADSNHFWHIFGGFLVAFCTFHPLYALYVAFVSSSCLELKDFIYGNPWDWTDWWCTMGGGFMAAILHFILYFYFNLLSL